jgi:hypothetical protein
MAKSPLALDRVRDTRAVSGVELPAVPNGCAELLRHAQSYQTCRTVTNCPGCCGHEKDSAPRESCLRDRSLRGVGLLRLAAQFTGSPKQRSRMG